MINKWTVYRHTSPSGKVYKRTKYEISKTGKDNIKNRLLKYYKTHSSPRKGIVLSE